MFTSSLNYFKNMHLSGHKVQRFYYNSCSQNWQGKKIVIIIVGENHTDPGPIGLIRQQMKKNHSLGLNQILCLEQPYDLKYEELAESIRFMIEQNEYLLTNESLKSLASRKHNLSYPYFSREIEEKICEIFSQISPYLGKMDAKLLKRYIHIKEWALLFQQIQELKIPYQGIEMPVEHHSEMIKRTCENERLVGEYEEIRIGSMTKNFFAKAFPNLAETGGIAWINTGAAHSAILAASIFNHIAEKKMLEEYTFQLIPTVCLSPYVDHVVEDTFAAIQQAWSELKNEMLISLTERMVFVPILDILETDKHTYESSTFNGMMKRVENFFIPANE